MVQPLAMFADGFEDRNGADDVAIDEWPRISQAIVIVAFGSKVHDDVRLGDELIYELTVADISLDEMNGIEDLLETGYIAGIGQLVDDGDIIIRLLTKCIVHEV